ncbi:molybdopterin-dependent oxidoreductase [Solirubrobacter ginsenosidimutans]|uniref:Molybdopterin-dependent oxidoreductase n=1 Tax=Solirubrobacter ginsenosidimutans TaxID=490573 RepID=A0A9X3MXJ9_9ACTN|nr:molybdopterin cofactor-binding domain-containing protein [Solirubrobacter ginsenosidimutans]MDA0164367.1 molybdopterin-dependent oxidoreductase [Solirubrobacter ginsenosidimutans]
MQLVVNGAAAEVDDRHAKTPLLWVLRDVLGLRGTKFGCGGGFCAACTVLVDGHNTKSCQTPAERAAGKAVTTVEGAAGPVVDAVRDAWHRGNVVQCGYCQPGQTLAAVSLLESDASPDDATIDQWMSGNLCRCGTYPRIRAAIHRAADTLAAGDAPVALVAPPELDVRRLTPEEASDPVHPYIRIHADGTVLAYSSQIEMGQGIHTGLATIVAEELDAAFDSVRVVNAANGAGPNGDVYGNPAAGGALQLTGASNSMQGYWIRYRLAAAQARARLVNAAAEAWDVPAAEVEVEDGVVRHASGRRAAFAELAARAEQLPVPDGVQPKDAAAYKLIGREGRLRVDAVGKILGATHFTIDLSLPGMLTALVLHPPRFGATAAAIDDRAALAEAGVAAVVPIDEGVAVVAENLADAQRGLRALVVEWDDANAERRSTEELLAEHLRLLESREKAVTSRDDGDVDRALADAASTVDATYVLPYLAHAAMEPNNAACRMRDDGVLDVWAGTEGPQYVKMNASSIAGIDVEQVEVHVSFVGGSFGLHSSAEHDPVAEAVQIAKALRWEHPIKVQSLREEEFKVGRYRAMAVHRVRAGADADGRLTAWHQEIVAAPTSINLPFVRDVMFTNGVDFFTTTGAVDPPYAVENFRVDSTNFESRISTMVWRSVGNSHTEFARESAIDELALAAGRDPVDLRRALLAGSPRTVRALELAAESAGWGSPLPEGHARGLTCSGFLGHSANVTEVSLDARGRVRVDRIVFALDCGRNVNPDLIRAQVEGGLLWGLSAAAWGEVVLGEGGEIVTQNFDRYPILRMRSVPQIEIHLIDSTEPPTGVGEVSVPSVAPALANAIAALTGTRIRNLPFSKTIKIA